MAAALHETEHVGETTHADETPPVDAIEHSVDPGFAARALAPGLILCVVAAGVSYGASLLLGVVSPLIVAIVLGVVLTNVVPLPDRLAPGLDLAARKLLRAGIVFLGLQVGLSDIAGLGAPMLAVIVCIVAGGVLGTVLIGRILGVPPGLTLLVACGFSICGAAAVAGAAGTLDPDGEAEQDTITAIVLVVIFGTLMIPALPLVAHLLGMQTEIAGLWAGGAIHEIAQVVAASGLIGGGVLTVAVVVKLARVLMLAPVVAILSIRQRRLGVAAAARGGRRPPIVPVFVLGFLAAVLLRSFVPLPEAALETGRVLQTVLLAAAMFALGCGVKVRNLLDVGLRPFALAALSTLLVSTIAFTGVTLVG